MDFATAAARSRINAEIRSFFASRGCTEVETPVLSPGLIPEAPIEVFETIHFDGEGRARPLYLLPSPELYMKKLIAGGSGDIYQIVRSFRNGEEYGAHHNPEFTMLEWYEVGAGYMDSIRTAEGLFEALADRAPYADRSAGNAVGASGRPAAAEAEVAAAENAKRLRPPFRTMSVHEAFDRYTGIDLTLYPDAGRLAEAAARAGLSPAAAEESWEQIFNRLLITFVEPNLPQDRPTVLCDYPAQIPALAKRKKGGPWLERWELYGCGIELANCYTEETDPRLIRAFCEREYAAKAAESLVVPDADEEFISMFEGRPFPHCSGTALGVDRLVMLLTGHDSLEGVIHFPFSDILGNK